MLQLENSKLFTILTQLGLSPFEAEVFGLILEDSNISVSEICRQTGKYRREVYIVFDKLKEIGLIERENDYKRKIKVVTPTHLRSILKEKQQQVNKSMFDLEEILPNLLASYFTNNEKPKFQVFEGINRFNFLFNSLLEEAKKDEIMYFFNEGEDLYNIIDVRYFLNIWVEKRVSKGVFAKILFNGTNSLTAEQFPLNKEKLREIKILPNNYQGSSIANFYFAS